MFNAIDSSKWENELGTTIYEDDFGTFHITIASDEFEIADSFEDAVDVAKVLEAR